MSNRLDNYFKERLRDHNTTPSSSAWGKVEAQISKKNNTATVLRIAAAIALIGLITIVLIDQQQESPAPAVSEKKNIQNQSPPVETPDKNKAVTANNTLTTESKKSQAAAHNRTERSAPTPQPEKNLELEATVSQPTVVMETIDAEQIVPQDKPKAKRIVIVYTLPTINKPAQDVAVAEEDKRNGLQRVMDVAMEVRASDSPLGQLREAKDDLFALEFKKDKNKTKN